MDGCPNTDFAPGNPNAHFSLSWGTWAAVSPAVFSDWNRVLEVSTPQPFQAEPLAGSPDPALAGQLGEGWAGMWLTVSVNRRTNDDAKDFMMDLNQSNPNGLSHRGSPSGRQITPETQSD